MNIKELTERDYKKAVIALKQAEKRLNIPKDELDHLKKLVELREAIMKICEDK